MKKTTLAAVALLGLAGWSRAETLNVVQITDMQGQVAYEVMTREEFAKLQKEIKEETAVFAPAAAEAKKEWDANKDNKFPFPGNRIKPRSAKKMGADFTDREKADKKRSQIEERAGDKQLEELKKEEAKAKKLKLSDEDLAKESARLKAVSDAYATISKKMADKLGREIPGYGLELGEPLAEAKKEEPKKKEEKKEEKKPEKPAGH